jgi:protein SCO1/2
MTDRRKMLAGLAAGTAALTSAALGAQTQEQAHAHRHDSSHDASHDASHDSGEDCECERPNNGPYSAYFPNVVVVTHEGRRALFYNDLLRGKTVLVNCMSIANDAAYPVTENLARVQRLLGERAGRDVFIYSITVDPVRDTPRALAEFAEAKGVGPGWLFLTGTSETVDTLRGRLFADAGGHAHHKGHAQDCSMGLVRYGNEAVGIWGSVPAKTDPDWIVRRLSWVTPRGVAHAGQAAVTFKRRGPHPVPTRETRRG